MAEKITLTDDNLYGKGRFELAVPSSTQKWTDGLPHDFKGWGPQTPDPNASERAPAPEAELVWRGEDDHHNNFVWHFDGRRSRHH